MNELGYEPLKEIVIHIGEDGEFVNTDKIRVYVDGVKIKNLRGFKFKAKMGEPPRNDSEESYLRSTEFGSEWI